MRRSLSLVGGLMLAVVLSQFPEYAQQYTQRLAGAVDELKTITGEFDRAAAAAGLSREAALARYRQSPDQFLAGRGVGMAATFQRYGELHSALPEIPLGPACLYPGGGTVRGAARSDRRGGERMRDQDRDWAATW